jgi:hypothetical protein
MPVLRRVRVMVLAGVIVVVASSTLRWVKIVAISAQ